MTEQIFQRQAFSERHGYKEPPVPLSPGNLSYELRNELWDILITQFEEGKWNHQIPFQKPNWQKILGDLWVRRFKQQRIRGCEALCLERCQNVFIFDVFYEVFDLLEDLTEMLGDEQPNFQKEINAALKRNRAPYIFHKSSNKEWIIIETGSGKEKEAVLQCLADISSPTFIKTRQHFEKAGQRLAKAEFPEATGQSAKALEACLRKLTNEPDKTGGQVLEKYTSENKLSPRLKQLMLAVWQYRNEAGDVGHAEKDDASSPPPDRCEAQLIYVTVAGCLSYLINKWREHN